MSGPVVLQVTPNLDIGGAQENVRTMSSALTRAGCPTVVCAFADGPLRADIEGIGVPVEVLPSRRHSVLALPWFLAEMLARRRDLVRIVREHRVEVVQTRGLGTLGFLVMTLRPRVRVWWTLENVTFLVREEHQLRHRWLFPAKRLAHRLLYRLGARIVNGVIVVSEETEAAFRAATGSRSDRVVLVPNAVDVERFPAPVDRAAMRRSLGLAPDAVVLTTVATFKLQKGHRVLIEAAARVLPAHPMAHLVFAGDGELRETVRAQAAALGIADRVHLLGSRRDVPELLSASDAFVLPSLWEGLPVALLEAMASTLPVVATDVSGTHDVMVDGTTGWVVPPGDAYALGCAIEDLLRDPVNAAAMGLAARARVEERFGARAQAERLAELFRGGRAEPSGRPEVPHIPARAR